MEDAKSFRFMTTVTLVLNGVIGDVSVLLERPTILRLRAILLGI